LARAGLTTKYTKDTKLGSGVWGHGMTRKITELGKGSLGPRNDTEDHGIGERMIECWSRGKGQTIVLVLSAAVIDSGACARWPLKEAQSHEGLEVIHHARPRGQTISLASAITLPIAKRISRSALAPGYYKHHEPIAGTDHFSRVSDNAPDRETNQPQCASTRLLQTP
jgi:hypothetical protein